MTAKELMQFMSIERLKTLFKKTAAGEQTAITAAGSGAEVGIKVGAATTEITADAVAAGAGAAKSQAGIPYVGPILAAASMAAMIAGVMALLGQLPSAAGGYWDVPHDTLAAIHKNEMVLPARHSAKLRGLLEGDGGFGDGEGSSGGGGQTVNVNINAMDAKSVQRLFNRNGAALARTLKEQARNFAFHA